MKKLVVIGGGAAGFFCAITAARLNKNLQVVLLEKTAKLLSKVRVSGGGRCNVTHALFDNTELSKRYPRGQHFVKKLLYQFSPADTINWFAERGVTLKTERDGRMFPVTDSSQTIVDCLMAEARKHQVAIIQQTEVKQLSIADATFRIIGTNGFTCNADFVCIACGGYPKTSMFDWLQNLGHAIAEPVPSLFTFNLPKHPITALMGVSVPQVKVKIEGSKLAEEGPVLITHWGLSGPAVLRLSAWGARELAVKNYIFKAHIHWVPAESEASLKAFFQNARVQERTKKISNHAGFGLPNRLWHFLLESAGISPDQRFADLPAKAENLLIKLLVDYVVDVQGKTTFKEEFVTAGGIQLSEVDAATMMSKKVANLFFAGEIVDVDGITGGFNFQHAWASGFVAGTEISKRARV
ncbi:MAG TPA: NAD(P)/FAD-dependent oxidoreductase [Chitinophagaceae bacterium]|nr:NAD(P)/FAD-dependent oxidoreductase [Chitinophagaceae bacterium]